MGNTKAKQLKKEIENFVQYVKGSNKEKFSSIKKEIRLLEEELQEIELLDRLITLIISAICNSDWERVITLCKEAPYIRKHKHIIEIILEKAENAYHENEKELFEQSSSIVDTSSARHSTSPKATYIPRIDNKSAQSIPDDGQIINETFDGHHESIFGRISRTFSWKRNKEEYAEVYSSIFAPAEVKRKSHMQVQIYLHLDEETEKVKSLAKESDKNAERRDYIPLSLKLKKGDKVDVEFNVYGETRLMSERKSIIWQGSFTKCSFDYFVPKDIDVEELSCAALLSVNGVPIGEMRFITRVIETPRQLNPEIIAHKYSKVFISYSHLDESKVKFLHEGLELGSVPHFFDRKYLKAGDVFPQVIQDYINSADLFILCWSENASKSEYVQKERLQALERAFPQVQPENAAKLRIYPMNIEPHAELPSDMKEVYNFEVI